MEFLLLLISAACLLVGVVGNHAFPYPSEIYWKNKLPNTPMPTIVHDLLHPEQQGKPSTDRAGSIHLHRAIPTTHYTPDLNTYSKNPAFGKSTTGRDQEGKRKSSVSQQLYVNQYSGKPPSQQLNKYSKDPPLGKSTNPNRSNLDTAAINRLLLDNPGASLFFLEKYLHSAAKMNLHFVFSTASGTTFLPQKLAKVTPFSSNKLPEILNHFAISPKSDEAEFIKETIMDCEQQPIENEEKYCATSLESLVDYGTSKFGKNVNILTTVINGDKGQRTQMKKQEYVVRSGVRQIASDNLVACHSLPYLYAVFYCHATSAHTTRTYTVPLVGADGMEIKATAVCHKDTSKWDPDHIAFQVLKAKPGNIPVCHFLTEDTVVWVARN